MEKESTSRVIKEMQLKQWNALKKIPIKLAKLK
jgi:hypothetical protein